MLFRTRYTVSPMVYFHAFSNPLQQPCFDVSAQWECHLMQLEMEDGQEDEGGVDNEEGLQVYFTTRGGT